MRSIFAGLMIIAITSAANAETIKVEGRSSAYGGGWTMDASFEHPQEILLQLAGETEVSRYWYVIMSVTNTTGQDVGLYPLCELMTDTYQMLQAGAGVRGEVYESIINIHRQKYPFLQPLEKTIGKLPQGTDHTKDVLLVWKDFDKDARAIKLFIAGLSSQTQTVEKPAADVPAEQVILRKTLELAYNVSGDPAMRSQASLTYKGLRWVMR